MAAQFDVRRRASTPLRVLIHPIVMDEKIGLQELKTYTCLKSRSPVEIFILAERSHQAKSGPETFATASAEVANRAHHQSDLWAIGHPHCLTGLNDLHQSRRNAFGNLSDERKEGVPLSILVPGTHGCGGPYGAAKLLSNESPAAELSGQISRSSLQLAERATACEEHRRPQFVFDSSQAQEGCLHATRIQGLKKGPSHTSGIGS
jgi:hypothetical protein